MTILCLGADVLLSLVPKGGFSFNKNGIQEYRSGIGRANAVSDDEDDSADDSVDDYMANPDACDRKAARCGASSPRKGTISKGKHSKKYKDRLLVNLVHGDVLMLTGDDFEVSAPRSFTPSSPDIPHQVLHKTHGYDDP